jgi:hypothetical protein
MRKTEAENVPLNLTTSKIKEKQSCKSDQIKIKNLYNALIFITFLRNLPKLFYQIIN